MMLLLLSPLNLATAPKSLALRTHFEQTAALRTFVPLQIEVNSFARIANAVSHSEQNHLALDRSKWQAKVMTLLTRGCETRDGAALWSAFWRTSTRDGSTAAFPPAAQQKIREGWRRLLEGRPAGTRMLDIACGRGAVLALGAAAGIQARTGVDIAQVDAIAEEGEQILGGIDARDLPFEDATFDLVVSQFGLEYAGLATALTEAARVARGEIAILLHAADGAVVAHASEQASQAVWLDEELDGFGAIARRGSDLSAVLARVAATTGSARNTALLEAFYINAQALAKQADPAPLAAFATEWRAHAARMLDLVRAAPGFDEATAAAAMLGDRDFVTDMTELRVEGMLVGRWLVGRRETITDKI